MLVRVELSTMSGSKVVFGTLVGVFVFSVMCYVVRVADDICY